MQDLAFAVVLTTETHVSMPAHELKRCLPYSPRQLFDLVADVGRYPEFLPWCQSVRILEHGESEILAELVIGYKMFRESFLSKDILTPPDSEGKGRIDVEYCDGPFRYLHNSWIFSPQAGPHGQQHCQIDFTIDFEFRSPLFRAMVGAVFDKAMRRLVISFENRARQIYDPPPSCL